MKAGHKKKALTFGDLIAVACDACGPRKARANLRLAVKRTLVDRCKPWYTWNEILLGGQDRAIGVRVADGVNLPVAGGFGGWSFGTF